MAQGRKTGRYMFELHDYFAERAWKRHGGKIACKFAGERVIPIPFICEQIKRCPCVPGSVIMSLGKIRIRNFQRWIQGKRKRVVLTECIWDFNPVELEDQKKQFLASSCIYEDNDEHMVYEKYARKRFLVKYFDDQEIDEHIRFELTGREITELRDEPVPYTGWEMGLQLFDDTNFKQSKVYMVKRVYSAYRMCIEVNRGNKVYHWDIRGPIPIGFTLKKLKINDDPHFMFIKSVEDINPKKWKVRWEDTYTFKSALCNFLPNQSKYDGPCGDVRGRSNTP